MRWLLLLVLVGCKPEPLDVRRGELAGTWQERGNDANELHTYNSDGTYNLVFHPDVKPDIRSGRWRLSGDPKQPTLETCIDECKIWETSKIDLLDGDLLVVGNTHYMRKHY